MSPPIQAARVYTHHRHLLLLLSPIADTHFTVPQRVEGLVDLAGWLYIPRWFTRLQTVTHPGTNRVRRSATTLIFCCRRREPVGEYFENCHWPVILTLSDPSDPRGEVLTLTDPRTTETGGLWRRGLSKRVGGSPPRQTPWQVPSKIYEGLGWPSVSVSTTVQSECLHNQINTRLDKKLSCRRETARYFVLLNISLNHSRSFEMTSLRA